jgi:Ino eighty subunit 2
LPRWDPLATLAMADHMKLLFLQMETINKLLKKQAPKTNRRAPLHGDEGSDGEGNRPDARFVRWVSRKEGTFIAVPEEVMAAPPGAVFKPGGVPIGGRGRMVEEVA